ncbi:hypothetical protein [Algoriphagus halophilus]|uniref:DUF2971 domain-containing protein n=1 Tax=Algoriphagus halophilus TaxID=226505 RepID=A0A1N6GIK0_9BACT|nr:hypothetical protein [Algoriphagus halophilus]SIO07353.1 hypothetical protein SAMN05444394_3280 [Algoriphagus halophilus]
MPINEDHPIMNPPDKDVTLWRYMDIPSFMALLTNQELTFVRGDLFEDKYEGVLPKKTSALIDESTRREIKDGKLDKRYWNFSQILNNDNKNIYLSCWTKENHEMVHMWKIYSKENGIAIKTSYEKLKRAIETKEDVYPTVINYIDFDKDIVDWKSNGLTAFTIKRNEYKSEKEFRLIISYPRELEDQLSQLKTHEEISPARRQLYLKTPVIKCKVNADELISNIQVSPYAPDWYLGLIKDIIKKYNLKIDSIKQSEL